MFEILKIIPIIYFSMHRHILVIRYLKTVYNECKCEIHVNTIKTGTCFIDISSVYFKNIQHLNITTKYNCIFILAPRPPLSLLILAKPKFVSISSILRTFNERPVDTTNSNVSRLTFLIHITVDIFLDKINSLFEHAK